MIGVKVAKIYIFKIGINKNILFHAW
ncbi:hypothetical protein PI27_gp027 [Listeria phage WIL-1]|nr:hypothetical protein PI27_gp027 [Listeria phage WIL-1]